MGKFVKGDVVVAPFPYSIPLSNLDFKSGTLHQDSFVRPNRLFTADSSVVLYKAGDLKRAKMDEVIEKIIAIIRKD